MGGLHRLAYLLIGVATIVITIVAPEVPRIARIGLGIVGLMALASSLSGYCVTCHTLGLTTRDNRVRRIS
jgi:Protein of unknown function (DUF2892)